VGGPAGYNDWVELLANSGHADSDGVLEDYLVLDDYIGGRHWILYRDRKH